MEPGLSTAEAKELLTRHGLNVLPEKPPVPFWRRFADQFRSPLIYILLIALAIDLIIWFAQGRVSLPFESFAIGLILLLNAGLGVYQESKAEAALKHLKALAESFVWVLRDGRLVHLPSAELVPGDIVRIEAGDRIPADGTLIDAQGISVDESVLTGESLPVEKAINSELFSGTLLVRGLGYLKVTRTGEQSAAGNLAVMIVGIEAEQTPLQRRLAVFGNQVARWVFVLAIVIIFGGLFVEGVSRLAHILLFAVALAVAAVPEGLPAVLTLTLALGVERMARKKAVVRRLSAVEALGSVTVIATDKTGTLTENRMHVRDVDSPDTKRACRAMAIANDAEPGTAAGDPLEIALLDYVTAQRFNLSELRALPRRSVLPFDSSYKFMRVTVEEDGQIISYLKGAPEVLLERSRLSENERTSWQEKAESYAIQGFRVLALAWTTAEKDRDVTFIGLVLLWDPPRAEVPEAIRKARDAGIRVIMVTGDHPATAVAVANEVGIPPGRVMTGLDLESLSRDELSRAVKEANVFARVAPQDKLRLVEALKSNGEIVAVTGDGVNDAPALKRSNVGVAMGQRGSDVSREVADLVLLDDNFATIVAAIQEGRNIYGNIQKFIRFLFSTNLSETLIVVLGLAGSFLIGLHDVTGGLLLPLTAAQLLWVNVVTDGPPALALGLDRDPSVLRHPPRDPKLPLLDRVSLQFILLTGLFKALVGLALLIALPWYGYAHDATRSVLFLYMSIGQLVFAYPTRHIDGMPRTNIALHLALVLGVGIQILTVIVPPLRRLLGLELPGLDGFVWVAGAVLLSWGLAEAYTRVFRKMRY
ncbi:MAG TPA: cation-transporting P-type ATPase [Pyrinomonadaceae bacterium]|nr:cation-transporting P-type ATPase [Pyrinomonadaceae bacterium]